MDKRARSPNYPALSLPEAIEKVAAAYRSIHNHAAPREVVAKAMGYTGLNGTSATAISALNKYGLFERAGDDIKVSDRALRILHPHSASEKAESIRQAAYSPQLFAELSERFPDRIPNEELLRNYLVRKGFAPGALASVISAYRETLEMLQHDNAGAGADSPVGHFEESRQIPPRVQAIPSVSAIASAAPTSPQAIRSDGEERQIGRYDFEGGAYVRISVFGNVETEAALDMAQVIIELKRKELARKNKTSTEPQLSLDETQ